jgi:uncharacterized OsmC-like protein
MIRYIPLQYTQHVVQPLSLLESSFRSCRISSTSTTATTNKDSHHHHHQPYQHFKKNPYWKTYSINGHTMDQNMNGTTGWTGTIPNSVSDDSTTTTSNQQLKLENDIRKNNHSHILYTDLPYNMGGTNTAVQPIELLLMSFIGCTQATAFYVSRHIQTSLSSSLSPYVLQHIEFHNILAERDIRGSIHPKIIPIINSSTNNATTTTTTTTNHMFSNELVDDCNDNCIQIPSRIQQISGEIIVYFGSNTSTGNTSHIQNETKYDDKITVAGKSVHQQQQQVDTSRIDYLYTLQIETEKRCPIANMIKQSGCTMDHILWKDGGEYKK